MKLVKVSPAGRTKEIAHDSNFRPHFSYNHASGKYEFVIELYDNASGTKYKISGNREDWENKIKALVAAFEDAPKA